MTKILGIHDGHDCGAVILNDTKIISAINEERLSRSKLIQGFPLMSIHCVLQQAKLEPKDIDLVAVASKNGPWFPKPIPMKKLPDITAVNLPKQIVSSSSYLLGDLFKSDKWIKIQKFAEISLYAKILGRHKNLKSWLKQQGFECPVKFVDHHNCHAASAYYTGGKDKALVLTTDAAGDALCSIVATAEKGEMHTQYELGSYNSIAKYYAYVTKLCGFTPNKHEGKITGLAAYGKPKYLKNFKNWVRYKDGRIVNYSRTKHGSALRKIQKELGNFEKMDLAASVQQLLEESLTKYVSYWVEKTGFHDIVLAGGVFANVKLNQRLLELPNVDSVFIHPHMGDGGLGMGAAFYALAEHCLDQGKRIKPIYLDNAYFGPSYSNEEIQEALEKHGLKAREVKDPAGEAAQLVAEKKSVGFFQGRMEYGPRALGNRSILADPTDKSINDWLNKRLTRNEFMPFAPSILDTGAPAFYQNYKQGAYPARSMTITFDVPAKQEKMAQAVVHVDHTARPQVVDKKANKKYYATLQAYQELTGLPLFVNTSFNVHEEPIVCKPEDAIRSFERDAVDAIVLENFVVTKGKSN